MAERRRILFAVPPFTGHINPTLGVAAALEARGAEVAWVGHPTAVRPLIGSRRLFELEERLGDGALEASLRRAQEAKGLENVRSRFEDIFFPLARGMRDGVEAALQAFEPHLLVVDHQAFGGAMAARRRGVRWATLATTSVPLLDPFGPYPQVKRWVESQFELLQRESGLEPAPEPELSPELVVVTSVPELALGGTPGRLPEVGEIAWCGPIVGGRPATTTFPWERLASDRRRVLVSLGTVNMELGTSFFAAVRAAAAALDAPQFVVIGREDVVGALPEPSFRVDWAPQLELLPHLDAVVCHGGHNTVVEALAAGKPLVVAPIKDDQPLVAQQVVGSGVGLRIHAGRRATVAAVQSAVSTVLSDAGIAERVARVSAALRAAGGAERAAERLLAHAG